MRAKFWHLGDVSARLCPVISFPRWQMGTNSLVWKHPNCEGLRRTRCEHTWELSSRRAEACVKSFPLVLPLLLLSLSCAVHVYWLQVPALTYCVNLVICLVCSLLWKMEPMTLFCWLWTCVVSPTWPDTRVLCHTNSFHPGHVSWVWVGEWCCF